MKLAKEYQVLYKHPRINGLATYLIFYLICILVICLIFILEHLDLSWIAAPIMLISGFIIFYSFTHGYWHDITKYYLEHIPDTINYKDGNEYAGVVIADNNLRFFKYFHIYNGGVLLLIENLRNKEIPIKIIKKATIQSFRSVVYDPNCTQLFIFGHGRKYGLRIDKKEELLSYSTMADAPHKCRIEQLHCNHKAKKGKSLAELLGAEEHYKTDKQRTVEEVINCCLYEFFS
jgi:hypothetical protein